MHLNWLPVTYSRSVMNILNGYDGRPMPGNAKDSRMEPPAVSVIRFSVYSVMFAGLVELINPKPK